MFGLFDKLKLLFFGRFISNAKPGETFVMLLLRNFFPFFTFKKGETTVTVVSRAKDLREILDQSTIFGNGNRPSMDPAFAPGFFMMARDFHEPEHDHEKSIMKSLLLREDLPKVRELAFNLAMANIEEAMKDGATEFDAVSVLSKKVPIQIVDQYFGFTPPDIETMSRWSDTLQGSFFYQSVPGSPYTNETAGEVGVEARKYIREVLLPKKKLALKKNPNLQDPVSRMLRTMLVPEANFDEERVIANTLGLLVGTVETNNNAILKGLDRLMAMPHAMALAREAAEAGDDEKFKIICWEANRWGAPGTYLPRIVNEDVVLGGHKFKKGTKVVGCHRAAFFDPAWVYKPNEFRLDRPFEIIPAFHFGSGVHACLGNFVAMEVMPMVIKAVLMYKPNVEKSRGELGELELKPNTKFIKECWLRFTDEKFVKPKEKSSLVAPILVLLAAVLAYSVIDAKFN